MTQNPGFGSHQQTTLPLVKVREQHRELQAELNADLTGYAHTTPTSRTAGSNTLILGRPLGLAENQHADLISVVLLVARNAVTSAGVRNLA
ncbi:hypothetical protein, partial [Streptomyces zaomyceticus]|uniref:hypothetical protein n=1 Tax=Streptomyces zaomyceticus TaxID=68286 RepID=UPI00368A173C